MSGDERVVLRFVGLREAGDAAVLAERGKGLSASRKQLVRIALMSDVEHDPVARAVVYSVQRDGQLDRAEIGSEVASRFGDGADEKGPDLGAKRLKLLRLQFFDVVRRLYRFQDTQNAPQKDVYFSSF